MKKIKQSFEEVVAGDPRKEHYVVVATVIALIAASVGVCVTAVSLIFHFWK